MLLEFTKPPRGALTGPRDDVTSRGGREEPSVSGVSGELGCSPSRRTLSSQSRPFQCNIFEGAISSRGGDIVGTWRGCWAQSQRTTRPYGDICSPSSANTRSAPGLSLRSRAWGSLAPFCLAKRHRGFWASRRKETSGGSRTRPSPSVRPRMLRCCLPSGARGAQENSL